MARKKTILKSHILDTAYDVVKTEGFEGFTAYCTKGSVSVRFSAND